MPLCHPQTIPLLFIPESSVMCLFIRYVTPVYVRLVFCLYYLSLTLEWGLASLLVFPGGPTVKFLGLRWNCLVPASISVGERLEQKRSISLYRDRYTSMPTDIS